ADRQTDADAATCAAGAAADSDTDARLRLRSILRRQNVGDLAVGLVSRQRVALLLQALQRRRPDALIGERRGIGGDGAPVESAALRQIRVGGLVDTNLGVRDAAAQCQQHRRQAREQNTIAQDWITHRSSLLASGAPARGLYS